jgi:hypothetical protein
MEDRGNIPGAPKILLSDTNLRLPESLGVFTLEYLDGRETQSNEQYTCKLCALRAVFLALVQLTGPCHCSPSVLRLENTDMIAQFAGRRN